MFSERASSIWLNWMKYSYKRISHIHSSIFPRSDFSEVRFNESWQKLWVKMNVWFETALQRHFSLWCFCFMSLSDSHFIMGCLSTNSFLSYFSLQTGGKFIGAFGAGFSCTGAVLQYKSDSIGYAAAFRTYYTVFTLVFHGRETLQYNECSF